MNTTVVVRPVTEADADSLGRVHAACWHESYDHILSKAALSQLHPERLAQMWRRFSVQGTGYRHVVAELDGEIVGFAGSGPGRDAGKPTEHELYFVYLLQAHQGSGIGQALFDAVVDPGPTYLWVAADNPRAHRFYARNGYLPDGQERTEEVLGEPFREVGLER